CNPTSSKFIHTWLRFGEIMRGSLSAGLVCIKADALNAVSEAAKTALIKKGFQLEGFHSVFTS
ncbi:hypothetical protein, partial [Escherichia coli]|uniref:hypothetical protein n=1 Tax=Escherichia coli TaxID=562 RepID=UPI001FF55F3B